MHQLAKINDGSESDSHTSAHFSTALNSRTKAQIKIEAPSKRAIRQLASMTHEEIAAVRKNASDSP